MAELKDTICPMMSLRSDGNIQCRTECVWYMVKANESSCAIKSIAIALNKIMLQK